MSRDVSGLYTLPAGNPVVTATTITTTWANTTLTDIANALSDSLSRSGQGAMTAALRGVDGTVGAPGFAFASETSLGLYRAAASVLGVTGSLRAIAGTMAAPSIQFANAPATGFYSSGAGVGANLCAAINGENILTVTTSGLSIENPGATASGTFTFLDIIGDFNTFSITRSSGITFRITGDSIYTTLGTVNAVPLRIVTTNTERARFDTDGTLCVGHTSTGYGRLSTVNLGTFSSAGADNWKKAAFTTIGGFGGGLSMINTGGISDGYCFYLESAPSNIVLRYGNNGGGLNGAQGVFLTSTGTSWASASDERQKDIIEPITGALDKLAALRTVIGKYKTDAAATRYAFLFAQDVQAVLPEAVCVADDAGHLGLRYTDLIPLIIAAINELRT